jgi:hypothetical protein
LNSTTGNIGTLNTTTINNTGTITSDILTATTSATIPTLNTDTITSSGSITTTYLNMKNGGFVYNGDTSTYSEQYINTNTNTYMYTLYPPINKAVWIINGNNTLTLDDTKILAPQIDSTTINNTGAITTDSLTLTSGTLGISTLETNNIETVLTTDELTITGKILNYNGTQVQTRAFMCKNTQTNPNYFTFETRNNNNTIEFHSYEFGNRRDGLIRCTGGSDTINDMGSMNFLCDYASFSCNTVDIPTLQSSTITNSGIITSNNFTATLNANIPTIYSTNINNTGILTSTTINNTGITTTGTLASTTINNSGTTTSNILNATTSGTIPALTTNSITKASGTLTVTAPTIQLNGTVTSTTINNSGTLSSTTINNSGTTTSNILNATTSGTIPALTTNSIAKASGTLTVTAPTIQLNGNLSFTNFISTQTIGGKAFNTTYTNTKTSPIFISVSATGTVPAGWLYAKTDSSATPTTIVSQTLLYNNVAQSIFFIVLPGNKYRVEATGGGGMSLLNWTEWG